MGVRPYAMSCDPSNITQDHMLSVILLVYLYVESSLMHPLIIWFSFYVMVLLIPYFSCHIFLLNDVKSDVLGGNYGPCINVHF